MMRFYGISDRTVLDMPFPRLLLLYSQIAPLQAEEELSALTVQYTADPRRRAADLQRVMNGTTRTIDDSQKAVGRVPGITYEREAGSIAAERARQMEAAERLEREYRARQHAVSEQHPHDHMPPSPSA